jgi:ATP-dependent DNA ligase
MATRDATSRQDNRRLGIVLSDHTNEDGTTVFLHACKMGLEGIVSKRLVAPYRSGPSGDWLKVKNPDSPAMITAPAGRLAPTPGRTGQSSRRARP